LSEKYKDTKPVVEDTKPVVEDTKSAVEDTKPVVEETKSVVAEIQPIVENDDWNDKPIELVVLFTLSLVINELFCLKNIKFVKYKI
jgi:hypothetical protein